MAAMLLFQAAPVSECPRTLPFVLFSSFCENFTKPTSAVAARQGSIAHSSVDAYPVGLTLFSTAHFFLPSLGACSISPPSEYSYKLSASFRTSDFVFKMPCFLFTTLDNTRQHLQAAQATATDQTSAYKHVQRCSPPHSLGRGDHGHDIEDQGREKPQSAGQRPMHVAALFVPPTTAPQTSLRRRGDPRWGGRPSSHHSCLPLLRNGSWGGAPSTSAAVSAASGLVAAPSGCQSGAAVGSRDDAQGSSVAWTPDGGHWSGM